MNRIIFFLAGIFLLYLSSSCTQKKQDALRDELMAIHDDVMPKMGELSTLAGQLKQIIATDSTLTETERTKIESAIMRMALAEEGMMDWMATFRQPEMLRGKMENEAILQYLEAEKQKINDVSVQIRSGIEDGKQLISAHQ
jgi:outer membrane lipoprotein-sorting protein